MEIVIYIIAFVILYYALQIGLLYYGIGKVLVFKPTNFSEVSKFSIVIPFRNEENNLNDFLESISRLKYDTSNFELIFVNDASTDTSVQIINSWRFKNPYVQLTILDNIITSKSPKKDAITRALTIAKFNWIFVTDADCILPENILAINSAFLIQNPTKEFIIGGVAIKTNASFWSKYQSLDMASLQAVTIGSFGIGETFMCNGANMLYSKSIFNKVNGYAGVNTISSGDDVFLLQKIKEKFPDKIGYLLNPDALVLTKPVAGLTKIIDQRCRWGKKTVAYKNIYPKILGVITIVANLGLLVLFAFCFFVNKTSLLYIIIFKLVVDLLFLLKYSKLNVFYFIPVFIVYPFVLLFISIKTLFWNIKWKSRKV